MLTILEQMAWMDDAACKGADNKLFFPGHDSQAEYESNDEVRGPGAYKEARAICRRCPVIQDCLHYALVTFVTHDDDHGMWGGTSPRERRRIKRDQRINKKLVA